MFKNSKVQGVYNEKVPFPLEATSVIRYLLYIYRMLH